MIFGYSTISNFVEAESVFDNVKCMFNFGTYRWFAIVNVSFPVYRVVGYFWKTFVIRKSILLKFSSFLISSRFSIPIYPESPYTTSSSLRNKLWVSVMSWTFADYTITTVGANNGGTECDDFRIRTRYKSNISCCCRPKYTK